MQYLLKIETDGRLTASPYDDNELIPLGYLQALVGGCIEVVECTTTDRFGHIIICNEEGKINGMKMNRSATEFAKYADDILFGPCVIAKADGEKIVGLSNLEVCGIAIGLDAERVVLDVSELAKDYD